MAVPTLEMMAAIYDTAVREICERLSGGTLVVGLAPIAAFVKIGVGQSMGGCITIVTQGGHRSFDAVAPLGFSAIHTVLPQPTFEAHEKLLRAAFQLRRDNLTPETIGKFSSANDHYIYHHHWEDVPEDIVACDKSTTVAPPFRSETMPWCGAAGLIPRCVSAEAAAIEAPLFIGVGERDVCPAPRSEPQAYQSARDITLIIVPTMAHIHNFASTRELLWDQLHHWICKQVASPTAAERPREGRDYRQHHRHRRDGAPPRRIAAKRASGGFGTVGREP